MILAGLVALGTLTLAALETPQLSCHALPPLLRSMQEVHYARNEVSNLAVPRSVDQFIKALDPLKLVFLQKEVDSLKRELPRVFKTMRDGDCGLLEKAAAIVIQRAEEDERIVKALLDEDYVLDESVELPANDDKRQYAATEAERAAGVRKMVHFQVSGYLLAKTKLAVAKKRVIHRYELVTKRAKERRSPVRLPEVYAEAFASSLDPHSSFLSAETLADFQIHMRLSLEGIGALLQSEDGFTMVQSLVPGGQADKEGTLRPKDKIIAVAQEGQDPVQVIDMDLRDVVKMIRGKKGTKVSLTVMRDGQGTFDVVIVRDKIDVKDQAAKITYETSKKGAKKQTIGVLELPSFYGGEGGRSSYKDVKQLLREAKARKVDALVLDLSKNGGGLLDEAVRISGLFLRAGAIVATRSFAGDVKVLSDDDEQTVYSGPLVVLVSRASASASEILAGALKDYGRAVVVGGEHTFGKGTVQQLSNLPGGLGAVKITMGMFFLPAGASTQQNGVRSDVVVPSVFDGLDFAEKELDYSLPSESTPPFLSKTANDPQPSHHWQPVSSGDIASLVRRSKERVAKDKVMQAIIKEVKEKKAQAGPVRLSDLRKEAKKNKAADDEAAKAEFERKIQALSNEAVNIAVDLVQLQNEA